MIRRQGMFATLCGLCIVLCAACGASRTTTSTTAPANGLFFGPLGGQVLTHLRAIYQRGHALGNRADVFAKVGDSNTANGNFLQLIGCGYGAPGLPPPLGAVVRYFSQARLPAGYVPFLFARRLSCPSNSLVRIGYSAHPGWRIGQLFGPFVRFPVRSYRGHFYPAVPAIPGSRIVYFEGIPKGNCPGFRDNVVLCELHSIRPSVALVMIGTNDLAGLSAATFARSLDGLVSEVAQAGTIPVLSTIPPRLGFEAQVADFNRAIARVADLQHLPLWDLWRALTAPGMVNEGLGPDGVHLGRAPDGASDLRPSGLRYGANLRNLQALEVLAMLRRAVLAGR